MLGSIERDGRNNRAVTQDVDEENKPPEGSVHLVVARCKHASEDALVLDVKRNTITEGIDVDAFMGRVCGRQQLLTFLVMKPGYPTMRVLHSMMKYHATPGVADDFYDGQVLGCLGKRVRNYLPQVTLVPNLLFRT